MRWHGFGNIWKSRETGRALQKEKEVRLKE
jgi:hypothetical protein